MAQAMTETKSTDTAKLIEYFEKESRVRRAERHARAYFRNWDHQLMQEAYPFSVKEEGPGQGPVGLPRPRSSPAGRERAARSHRADQGAEPLLDR